MFGSALRSPQPEDIDLLVVYDDGVLRATVAASVRGPFADATTGATGLHAHIVVLSRQEAASTRFAENEGATLLYKRT